MCYKLPKIWLGRIQKYWDKIMPSDYPASDSVFALKFDTEEITAAVVKFEDEIGKPESVVTEVIPEGNVLAEYIGTYDVKGTPGVLTLLSPEKVTTDKVAALHLTADGTWEDVEDAHVIDGYVWGTLDSFSPVAIVTYRKDIHVEDLTVPLTAKYIVCEGNTVKVTQDEDGKITLRSESTGTEIELTESVYIVGGSIDGSNIDKTSITVAGITDKNIIGKIIGGSVFCASDDAEPATVNEININIIDSVVKCVTGSMCAVRTNQFNLNMKNVELEWFGMGESYSKNEKKDYNTSNPSYASKAWLKSAKLNIENVVTEIAYCCGNNGYLFVDHSEATVIGGKIDYLLSCGSNGITNESIIVAKNAEVKTLQNVNRGIVGSAKVTLTGCKVEGLFIDGDETDETAMCNNIRYDINAANGEDMYNINVGMHAGKKLTAEQIAEVVDCVKVSRSANVTISKEDLTLLGDKYIVK